ncbi:MAG: hypothetical protein M1541_13360 [Acidobacteria bacterium]|nr:hypothetical protein [Acidobacteriota bacterium]
MSLSLSRRAFVAGVPVSLMAFKSDLHIGCQTNSWPIDPKKLSSFAAVVEKVRTLGFQGIEPKSGSRKPPGIAQGVAILRHG